MVPRMVFYYLNGADGVPVEVEGQPRPALVLRDDGADGMRLKVFLDPKTDGGEEVITVTSRMDGSEPGQWAPAIQ